MFKTNEYFDGNVVSIAFQAIGIQGQQKPATVGVMAAGNYVFNTSEKEKMTVVSGQLVIKLEGQFVETTYSAGESFEVPANSSFDVAVKTDSAYLCEYG